MSGDALTATLFIFVSFEYFVVPYELSGLNDRARLLDTANVA